MPEDIKSKQQKTCPYLGIPQDPATHFSQPELAHSCFVTDPEDSISLEHQADFCLTANHPNCSRYIEIKLEDTPAHVVNSASTQPGTKRNPMMMWGIIGITLAVIVALIFFFAGGLSVLQSDTDAENGASQLAAGAEATATETPPPTATSTDEVTGTPTTSVSIVSLSTPTPNSDQDAEGNIIRLAAAASDSGWVVSDEDRGNHFGDSYLYVGVFDGQVYQSGFQFDLALIPRGAPIEYAAVELTGLRDDRLDIGNSSSDGVWTLQMLAPEIDQQWRRSNYQDVFNAEVLQTLNPILNSEDLAADKTNVFELSRGQIRLLEERVLNDQKPKISFRVGGPLAGDNNLFAWDTGHGPESQQNNILLVMHVGEAPATPPPFEYVLVTSTPTPENVVTAAAQMLEMTTEATRVGTATPLPPNVATATPIPDYLVIVKTPTPGNTATAETLEQFATAEALIFGTPVPPPTDAVTATPIPTSTATHTPTASATFILITSTPTPESVYIAATLAAAQAASAASTGTPTPLPVNWVTPIVVTPTSTPANAATAQALNQLATAIAFTTGTPTATPQNMVTATATPIYEEVPYVVLPTPTPYIIPDRPIPASLMGKILFKSDREGRADEVVYVYDPETGELGRLSDSWPYDIAKGRDSYSANTVYRAYTKELLWTSETEYAIHYFDARYNQESIVTRMGVGIVYDPAWSPTNNQIVFVSTESGNDEIWKINYDGTDVEQLTRNNWEWDKSPSWSPDGSQVVFFSNRTGNDQLWIMNADGSNQRLLMGWDNWNPHNDSLPVWVKYLEPISLK